MSEQPGEAAAGPGADVLSPFLSRFAPDPGTAPPEEGFLGYARGRVPEVLLELWSRHGVGFYGEQRLAVVDPGAWMRVLQTWLGDEVTSIPVVVTSFGHLYHWDSVEGHDRVQCLDPHFQTNTVVGDDLTGFLNGHLTAPGSHVADLEGPRGGARDKLGPLGPGEIYHFDPILALGGTVSPASLAKGNGPDHLTEIYRRVVLAG